MANESDEEREAREEREREERERDDRGGGGGDDDRDGGKGESRRERELSAEAAKYRRRLRDAEAERDELKRQQQSDSEKAVTDAVKKATDELETKHRRELVRLQVQLHAAAKLRDPLDAAAHLNLDELGEHADDPRAFERAVDDAVADLLERKPYLGRDGDDDDAGDKGKGGGKRGGLRDVVTSGSRTNDRDGGTRDRETSDDSWLRKAAKDR